MIKDKHKKSMLYHDNLMALKTIDPELAKRVDAYKLGEEYELVASGPNRQINVRNKKTGVLLYDEISPLDGIKSEFEALDLNNAKIAIFLGFGLGMQVDLYAREFADKAMTRQFLVIEKSMELFKMALHLFDYRPMFNEPKIKLIVDVPEENLFPLLSAYIKKETRVIYAKAIKPVYIYSVYQENKDYYLSVLKLIREATTFVMRYYGNSPDDSLIGVENMLDNVGEIISNPGINLLLNKFKNMPAVIVATGPSLNKNKHLLKGIEDKALVIAPDASLKILLELGVKPHMITALERIPETAELIKGYSASTLEDTYYAACPVIPHVAYEMYTGPKIIVYRNFDHFKWLGIDRGILDIKHSSGNMAFRIAVELGCNPIILVGQDLAYSRDGKSHASGTLFGEEQGHYIKNTSSQSLEVMGNDGMMIETHHDWNEFRLAYEIDIAEYAGQCINATEGGAYIEGTKVMTLQDAITQYIKEPVHPLGRIRSELSLFTNEDEAKDLMSVLGKIDEALNDLKKIQEICLSAIELINTNKEYLVSFVDDEVEATPNDVDKIRDITDEVLAKKLSIFKIQPTVQLFLMHIIQSYYVKFEMTLHEIPNIVKEPSRQNASVSIAHLRYFGVLHDIINYCLKSLEKAQHNLTEKNG